MKDKQYDPARSNEKAPAPGMAAVDTHHPEENLIEESISEQQQEGKQGNAEPLDENEEGKRG